METETYKLTASNKKIFLKRIYIASTLEEEETWFKWDFSQHEFDLDDISKQNVVSDNLNQFDPLATLEFYQTKVAKLFVYTFFLKEITMLLEQCNYFMTI